MKNLLSNDTKISFLRFFSGLTLFLPNYTGTHALPDMYALSPWASGIHIRQSTRACVITLLHINFILKIVNFKKVNTDLKST